MVAPTPDRAEIGGLPHGAEHDLVVGVRAVQERVVVELHDEGDAVHVPARGQAERAERRGDGIAFAGERQLKEVQRIEVGGVLGEARRRRVLDALVDREDGDVPGAAEASVVEHASEVAQHRRRAVAVGEHLARGSSGPGRVRCSAGNALARVAQEVVRFVAEKRLEVGAHVLVLMRVMLPEGQVRSPGRAASAASHVSRRRRLKFTSNSATPDASRPGPAHTLHGASCESVDV